MANREYEVTINNNIIGSRVLASRASNEGFGRLVYNNNMSEESNRKAYLAPLNNYARLTYMFGKIGYNDGAESIPLTANVDGVESTLTMYLDDWGGNLVQGENPVIPLYYKESMASQNFSIATPPESLSVSGNGEEYSFGLEVISSVDVTGATEDIEEPNTSGVSWNGDNLVASGGNYGSYSYTEDGQTVTDILSGYEKLKELFVKACELYDGTETSCVEIELSAVTTPQLVANEWVNLIPYKTYKVEYNTEGRVGDTMSYSGTYACEVCDSYAEYSDNNLSVAIDASTTAPTVDFTGAVSATTKYLFLVNTKNNSAFTVTKNGSTLVNDIIGVIKLVYTP